MKSAIAAIIRLCGLLLVTAGTAMAQESFTDLQTTLNAGDRILVTDDSGTQTRGTVQRIGPSSIRLSGEGVDREWTPQQVREIRRRGDSISNGLKIGIGAGIAVGAAAGLALASLLQNEGHNATGPFVAMVALGAGAGAGIGAGLDAAITGSTVVYRRSARTASITPLLSPDAQGIRFRVAF